MTDKPPIATRTDEQEYESTKYGRGLVTVELDDFNPRLDTYECNRMEYDPRHPELDSREYDDFRGMENAKFTVIFRSLPSEHRDAFIVKHVSIARGFRRSYHGDYHNVEWWSSAMRAESRKIHYTEKRGIYRTELSDYEMLWDWSSPDYHTWDDLMDALFDEGVPKLFDSRAPY